MKVIFYIYFSDLIKCKKLIAISYSPEILSITFIKNGCCHNSNNYAFYNYNFNKEIKDFYYKDEHFWSVKNISDWKKKVKELKRKEKLGIFK